MMYLQGRGVPRDLDQAFEPFQKAANQGYAVAQNNLALMYADGQIEPCVRPREIPRHRDLAVRGAPIACELNCIVSILLLPEIMQLPEDFL